MKKKTLCICSIILVIIFGLLVQDNLICVYVSLRHEKLESYASQMLENADKSTDTYGVWKTFCYPEKGLVEFHTGGWGLAPSSTYKGFYYSADNTHKLFSAAYEDAVSMKIDGDNASWSDGTDNHGTSVRIIENWFCFEASF